MENSLQKPENPKDADKTDIPQMISIYFGKGRLFLIKTLIWSGMNRWLAYQTDS